MAETKDTKKDEKKAEGGDAGELPTPPEPTTVNEDVAAVEEQKPMEVTDEASLKEATARLNQLQGVRSAAAKLEISQLSESIRNYRMQSGVGGKSSDDKDKKTAKKEDKKAAKK